MDDNTDYQEKTLKSAASNKSRHVELDNISDDTVHTVDDSKPSPLDFVTFVPWACAQENMSEEVIVVKEVQNEYVSAATETKDRKGKSKGKQLHLEDTSDQDKMDKIESIVQIVESEHDNVKITALYSGDNLVQIKFDRIKSIPRSTVQIIGLIVQFHPFLYNITINGGMDKYTLHEVCKMLPVSNITDICLDGAFLEEANYHILLDQPHQLRNLSLARCKITDLVVNNLAVRLTFPQPGSKALSLLNLSSNAITDEGAIILANALRSNRQLSYLNLSDNLINDEGAQAIMRILKSFPLTTEEVMATRKRYLAYLKTKNEFIAQLAMDYKCSGDVKTQKKKPTKSATPTSSGKKKLEKETSVKSFAETGEFDALYLEKAEEMAKQLFTGFTDPYGTNSTPHDGVLYCNGNNTLAYINLAYNNLSPLSIKMLVEVLRHQKNLNRKPKGLVRVNIEGNPLPWPSKDLDEIDSLIGLRKLFTERKQSAILRRTTRAAKLH